MLEKVSFASKAMPTRKEMEEHLETIRDIFEVYKNVIWAPQELQTDHFDRQPKLAKIALLDVRSGLLLTERALDMALKSVQFKEDEEEK